MSSSIPSDTSTTSTSSAMPNYREIVVSTNAPTSKAVPAGFRFAGDWSGIKRARADLGIILCDGGAHVAGCVTRNPLRAPCADRSAKLLHGFAESWQRCHGVIVNSGNANAMCGEQGIADDEALAQSLAKAAGHQAAQIFTASTGPIGVPLRPSRFIAKVEELAAGADATPEAFMRLADAIITTDTCTKVAHATVEIHGRPCRFLGVAKGSGMIHPDMATTLAFVATDASVNNRVLAPMIRRICDRTFNAITVDGDTSTNDTLLVLASGATVDELDAKDLAKLEAALHAVIENLAKQVAADGEGATRLLQIEVEGTPDETTARLLARGACQSSLFKCSVLAGEPGGWGRLCAAIGQHAAVHGLALRVPDLEIEAQGIAILRGGLVVMPAKEIDMSEPGHGRAATHGELLRRLRESVVTWRVKVGDGPGRATAWGCDLSYDYVRINADEAPTIEIRPDGGVSRNLSLGAYSPTLKHQLLVDGLGYVRRFTGMKLGVMVHGSMARKADRVTALAQDIELVADAGIRPLIMLPDREAAQALAAEMSSGAVRLTEVNALVPGQIAALLDRGHVVSYVANAPTPSDTVALAIKLGLGKLIVLDDDHGLHDSSGLVSQLTPEQALAGLDHGRFTSRSDEFLAYARQGARQSLPALHLLDGRMPHALVAELFTDQGVGTLITRQSV